MAGADMGSQAAPSSHRGDEIAEVGWYEAGRWPEPRTVIGPLLVAAALRGERGGYVPMPQTGEEPPGSVWPPDR